MDNDDNITDQLNQMLDAILGGNLDPGLRASIKVLRLTESGEIEEIFLTPTSAKIIPFPEDRIVRRFPNEHSTARDE